MISAQLFFCYLMLILINAEQCAQHAIAKTIQLRVDRMNFNIWNKFIWIVSNIRYSFRLLSCLLILIYNTDNCLHTELFIFALRFPVLLSAVV